MKKTFSFVFYQFVSVRCAGNEGRYLKTKSLHLFALQ